MKRKTIVYFTDNLFNQYAECSDEGQVLSGVRRVRLGNGKTADVYCDQDTDNGGWTVSKLDFSFWSQQTKFTVVFDTLPI